MIDQGTVSDPEVEEFTMFKVGGEDTLAHSSHPGEWAAATNGGGHWCGSVRDLNYDSGKPLPLMSA